MKSTRSANSAAFAHDSAWARAGLQTAWVLLGVGVALRVAGLWDFESTFELLSPPCLFHLITGIDCPGCGMTRAFLRLTHGDLAGAWSFHPFSPAVAVLFLGLAWGPRNAGHWLQHAAIAQKAAMIALTLLLSWWVCVKLLPLAGIQ